MRWISGVFFAALVALTLTTVAVRVANVRLRHELEVLLDQNRIRNVEHSRRSHVLGRELRPEALAQRWQTLLNATGGTDS
ncbi:MAG: hypothetical protein IT458_18820 [Planctomycetes bacterium]|nr:hypothetical protein [Planctomycetota bacterium]